MTTPDQESVPRSKYGKRLYVLATKVVDPEFDHAPNEFYKIASFDTPDRAKDVIRDLSKNPQKIPTGCTFDLRAKITVDEVTEVRTSELWAAVISTPELRGETT